MTWQEMSANCLRSAKRLAAADDYRGSINRAYYSAYCAVTALLVAKGIQFAHGWNNPSHDQLPELVGNNLPLPVNTKRRVRTSLRSLRKAREDSDYRPGISVEREMALDSIRQAISLRKDLGVDDE